jgi:hypothetical protein
MLRLAEIGLFLSPFAIFVLWRFLGPRVKPAALWTAMALVLAMAGLAVSYGLRQRLDTTERYIPAHIEGGRIIDGHGVDR